MYIWQILNFISRVYINWHWCAFFVMATKKWQILSIVILADLNFIVDEQYIEMHKKGCRKGWYIYVILLFIQYTLNCRPMCAFHRGTQPCFLSCGKHMNLEFSCTSWVFMTKQSLCSLNHSILIWNVGWVCILVKLAKIDLLH